jgi:hypothetical protein
MQMRRLREWARVLALGAGALVALFSTAVQGKPQATVQIPRGGRVIKIGPQAVVVEDANGNVSMYDDPSQQAIPCRSTVSCLGPALQIMSVFGVMVYEDLTDSIEGTGKGATESVEGLP